MLNHFTFIDKPPIIEESVFKQRALKPNQVVVRNKE